MTTFHRSIFGFFLFSALLLYVASPCVTTANGDAVSPRKKLNVLFIGNSYTARHHLADVVKAMAEAGQPRLQFDYSTVIYGGRTLSDHWRLGSQNIVNVKSLTRETELATVKHLELAVASDAKDKYAPAALKKHRVFLDEFESNRKKWDVVVLQSYRDDLEGADSLYAQFAPRFAELAKAQGARVVLYVTSPTTQNAQPLSTKPDREPVLRKTRDTIALANKLDAAVAPMALVGLNCQTQRPDFTLRYVNDAHLNKTMAYLTACSLYAAIFETSPIGLPVDSVTDIRYYQDDKKNKDRDRDGKPITQTFSDHDRADLQRVAWESYQEFQQLRN